jgi:hypothetical protein
VSTELEAFLDGFHGFILFSARQARGVGGAGAGHG